MNKKEKGKKNVEKVDVRFTERRTRQRRGLAAVMNARRRADTPDRHVLGLQKKAFRISHPTGGPPDRSFVRSFIRPCGCEVCSYIRVPLWCRTEPETLDYNVVRQKLDATRRKELDGEGKTIQYPQTSTIVVPELQVLATPSPAVLPQFR